MVSTSQQGIAVTVTELQRLRGDALRLSGARGSTVNSLFPGAYRAMFHGRGIDFDEVRGYQWGDDYRTLDWRVTARTGQLHTKLFHEERERTLHLVVDAGCNMHFGTRVQFKWVLAARVAALFGWLAISCGDHVAGVVYGDRETVRFTPPGRGEPGVLRLFNLLASLTPPTPGPASNLADGLARLRDRVRPGALVLIISDFADLDDASRRHLACIGNHYEMAGVHIFDPMESSLPPPGVYPITDGLRHHLLDCRPVELRSAFSREFLQRVALLRSTFHGYGARIVSLATNQPLIGGLLAAVHAGGEGRWTPAMTD